MIAPKDPEKHYWFRAKPDGLGWIIPKTGPGLWVTIGYVVVAMSPLLFPLPFKTRAAISAAAMTIATPILLGICVLKGEPTGIPWRAMLPWGLGRRRR